MVCNQKVPLRWAVRMTMLGSWVTVCVLSAAWKCSRAGPQGTRACRSWVVMDGLRSSLMAENVAGRYPMDVLNGVCAHVSTAFTALTVVQKLACCWLIISRTHTYMHAQRQ